MVELIRPGGGRTGTLQVGQDSLGGFPPGMTLYLPLTSNLLPVIGSGGAVTITRAGEKRTQNGANSFVVDATNTLSITENFLGIDGATGLLSEIAVTNKIASGGSDDMRPGSFGWTATNCTVSAKNVTDPADVANQAQTLTPSAAGGSVEALTVTACASKNAYADCYLRRAEGAAGSHTGQLIITDSAGTVVASKDITITAAYQRFFHEYAGTGGGVETLIFKIVPDKNATQAVDARMPFAEVHANNLIKTLPTSTLTTRAKDEPAAPIGSDLFGNAGTIYMDVMPLFTPGDGGLHVFVSVGRPMYAAYSDSNISVFVNTDNKMYIMYRPTQISAGISTASVVDVSPANFARGTWHKLAFYWSAAGCKVFLNGAAFVERGAGTMGAQALVASAELKFSSSADAYQSNSILKNVRGWKRALTDAEMARITS